MFLRLYVCVCVYFANKATLGSSPVLLMPRTLRNVTGTHGRETERGKKQRGLCDEASGVGQGQRFIWGLQGPPRWPSHRSRLWRISGSQGTLSSFYTWLTSLGKGDLRIPGSQCLWEAPTAPQLLFGLNHGRQRVERLYTPCLSISPYPKLVTIMTVGKYTVTSDIGCTRTGTAGKSLCSRQSLGVLAKEPSMVYP